MIIKRPPTHTGRIYARDRGVSSKVPTVKTARLIENRLTWRDAETGQLYSKVTGCVRPCNVWDTRTLDLDSVFPDA